MRKLSKYSLISAFILLFIYASPLWARGGGGCLLEGTPVNVSSGVINIENIKSGDYILSWNGAEVSQTKVINVVKISSDEYIEITSSGGVVNATSEHLFFINRTDLKRAGDILNGDQLLTIADKNIFSIPILSVKTIKMPCAVYDLTVDSPATFLAQNIVVHNKGCFLPDTEILLADGRKIPIRQVKKGDKLLTFAPDEKVVSTPVHEIITEQADKYYEITTDKTIIKVTPEHPLYIGDKTFRLADAVNVNDSIFIFNGKNLSEEIILGKKLINSPCTVYNLRTDYPNTFFANNIAVHNKGGGGSGFGGGGFRGGRHGGKGAPGWFFWIYLGIIIVVFMSKKNKQDENLDYCYPAGKIQEKAERTAKLLNFLCKQDTSVSPDLLKKTASETFLKLQLCWRAREYSPMQSLMMTDLYRQHLNQINSLIRNHEINVIDNVKIDFAEIVNIRYYEKKDKREFTVLIQARAKDYYIDDKTNEFLRGDTGMAVFQEFWTFQYNGTNWLLRQIEQTKESDILTERNFTEMFTDEQLRAIYREPVSKDAGPAGPEAYKEITTRDDRVHRHLNFLVQIDKIWNENAIKETARKIFIEVYLAREAGDANNIKLLLLPEYFSRMQAVFDAKKNRNETVEYRNLCVRRVDIVLIRNFSDNIKDEFTVRITAHAQKIVKRGDKVVYTDEYVSPFEEYWTFGRKDNQWMLKEILPSFVSLQGKADVDEDASKEQVEWYYTKDRAM